MMDVVDVLLTDKDREIYILLAGARIKCGMSSVSGTNQWECRLPSFIHILVICADDLGAWSFVSFCGVLCVIGMQQCGNHVPHLHIYHTHFLYISAEGHTDTPNISFIFIFATHFEYICYMYVHFVDIWSGLQHGSILHMKLPNYFKTSMRLQEPKNTWAKYNLNVFIRNIRKFAVRNVEISLLFISRYYVPLEFVPASNILLGPNEYFFRKNKYALVDSLINIFFVHFSYNMIKFCDCMEKKVQQLKKIEWENFKTKFKKTSQKCGFCTHFSVHFLGIFTVLHMEWIEKMLKNWEERILLN